MGRVAVATRQYMETLTISGKERERIKIMAGVTEEELTLVAAAGLMGVCYRQSKRIWRRYQDAGDSGLGHRLRGQPGVIPSELEGSSLRARHYRSLGTTSVMPSSA